MAGQPITLTIPPVGTPGTAYASQINTCLTTLETELERPVTPADMNINTDLSFLSAGLNHAIMDLERASFALKDETVITPALRPMTVFAGSSDGELYWNDNAGRQIQMTTNGAVNVSTTGGITSSGGPYGVGGVEVRWDSADNEYEFRSGAGANDYADLRFDDAVFSDGSGNFLRMIAPAMAADYTMTLPAAVPASNNTVVQMSTTGVLTVTPTPTIDTITTTGAVTTGGLITAGGGVTASATQHITVSGGGRYKHGNFSFTTSGCAFVTAIPSTNDVSYSNDGAIVKGAPGSTYVFSAPILLIVGERITGLTYFAIHGVGAGTRTYRLVSEDLATGTRTVEASATNTTSGDPTVSVTIALGGGVTILTGTAYFLEAQTSTANGDGVRGVTINYDMP